MAVVKKSIWSNPIKMKLTEEKGFWNFCLLLLVRATEGPWLSDWRGDDVSWRFNALKSLAYAFRSMKIHHAKMACSKFKSHLMRLDEIKLGY